MVALAVSDPTSRTVLKRDLLGSVCRIDVPAQGSRPGSACIERDTRDARWWLRLAARRLATREARALAALQQVPGLPRLLQGDGHCLRNVSEAPLIMPYSLPKRQHGNPGNFHARN
jgi:hypothetical protein